MDHTHAYISQLSDLDFHRLRQFAAGVRHPHASTVANAQSKHHLLAHVAHDSHKGGGLWQFIKRAGNVINPWYWYKTHRNIEHAKRGHRLSHADQSMAFLTDQAYKDVDERRGIGAWNYLPQASNKKHAIYSDDAGNYHMSIRGTADTGDLLPDMGILFGTQEKYQDFQDSHHYFKALQHHLPGQWQISGHSLGGSKAMWIGQQENVPTHAFNPGFNDFTDDRITLDYPHNIYLVQGDAVSNLIMARLHENTAPNVKIVSPQSYNPLVNHSINSFFHPGLEDIPPSAMPESEID